MSIKENFINNTRNLRSWADHNSPQILLGIGLIGFGATCYSIYRDAPKAKLALAAAYQERMESEEEITKPAAIYQDTKILLKYMWKDFLLAAGSATSFIFMYKTMNKKLGAAVAINAATIETLRSYKNAVKEEIGEKKEQEIRDRIVAQKVNENSEGAKEVIITNPGEILCKDGHTGRYFAASKDIIRAAENELNRRVYVEMFVSLNEFYDELNLSHVKLGDEIGWTTENPPRFSMDYAELAEDGRPCMLIDYDIELRTAPW